MVEPQTLFRLGLITISMTVFSVVVAGCLLWGKWLLGAVFQPEKLASNFSGVTSKELVTRREQTKPRWTILEFFLAFGLTIVASIVLTRQLLPAPIEKAADEIAAVEKTVSDDAVPPQDSDPQPVVSEPAKPRTPLRVQVSVHFFATAFSLAMTLIYLRVVHGATFARLGMIPSWDDIRGGLMATAWIFAPVLLVNLVVSQIVKYEHSVTDMLAQDNDLATFAFLMLSAAILTPIAEEFQFRLLLQGGLQRVADGADLDDSPTWLPKAWWPILVTSLVFACLHLGQGAAPIPLFFLSIGLGVLYQSTGRLAPAILVHMLLNGATLCLEFCRMNAGL